MTVRIEGKTIRVNGNSPVEDAESLLAALRDAPERSVDLSQAIKLHSASVQILLAFKPRIIGGPSDPFQAKHIVPLLSIDDGGKLLG